MKRLIKPKKLHKGDKIATVSLSSGRAGDFPVNLRYELGVQRLREEFGLSAIAMPNSLKGSDYIYHNPKVRADDLMEAFSRDDIKAIISNIGGEESIRILPYLDTDIIKNNPKIFLGYSDSTTTHFICYHCGLTSFYGPAVLTDFAENVNMFDYTKHWINKVLFDDNPIGEIYPSEYWTSERLEWEDSKNNSISRKLIQNNGFDFVQGHSIVRGHLLGGCLNVIDRLRGTEIFPQNDEWEGAILFIETSESIPSPQYFRYWLRSLASIGVLKKLAGIIVGKPYDNCYYDEYKETILKIVAEEEKLCDLPIVFNMNFGHTAPMFIIPYGALAEINCIEKKFSIIDNGVL